MEPEVAARPPSPRLPKRVEADPRAAGLVAGLRGRARLLWPGGVLEVATVGRSEAVASALLEAQRAGRLVRGLEAAEAQLEAEARGMGLVDRTLGAARGERISRLLVLADDGAERFYRRVESLLRRHGARVLALRLERDATELGALLFGEGRVARLVLLEHKEAVSALLLALAEEWKAEAGNSAP